MRALCQLCANGTQLNFWRTRAGLEADDPAAQCLLLSFCPEPLLIDGICCEPLEGWLRP